jgi:hypothetical protein
MKMSMQSLLSLPWASHRLLGVLVVASSEAANVANLQLMILLSVWLVGFGLPLF